MPGSAREEAERLVAAILARASSASAGGQPSGDGFGLLGESVRALLAGAGAPGAGAWATGSAECCVCPVCKAIAAVRDPRPETAERLAAGAGDLASGVAGVMRAFATLAGATTPGDRSRPPARRARPAPTPDQAWSAATRVDDEPPAPDEDGDPWGAASAADAREVAAEARARALAAEQARAREAAAVARARAAAAEQAVARAVERARSTWAGDTPGAERPRPAGSGDVWAMATAADVPAAEVPVMDTTEAAVADPAEPRSVDHELGASAPEDRDTGPGDDARPSGAV